MFSPSDTTTEKDFNHHAVETPSPDSPPKVLTQHDLLRGLSKSTLRSKTCKIEDTPSNTPHESSKPTERPSTEIEQPSPPQTAIYESSLLLPCLRCNAGAFNFCNDKQYWDIRLCSLVPFEDSSHQSFTDLCEATVKLEFFVDFPKPINRKYSQIKVPFVPTELINRVIPEEEAQKRFWKVIKSRKKENRKQVLTRSASNLVNLVNAIQHWPHPESSESDRQELYKKVTQMENAMIYFLRKIADAVDIKQIYIPNITGNELAEE